MQNPTLQLDHQAYAQYLETCMCKHGTHGIHLKQAPAHQPFTVAFQFDRNTSSL